MVVGAEVNGNAPVVIAQRVHFTNAVIKAPIAYGIISFPTGARIKFRARMHVNFLCADKSCLPGGSIIDNHQRIAVLFDTGIGIYSYYAAGARP